KISGREVVISPDLARVAMPIQQAAQVQPTETEQRILLLTRNLCERLNIKRFVPDQIAWALSIPMGRTVVLLPSDQFSFIQDNVFVPASLKERMQPEELEPLIASSLINDFVLFRERARKLAVRLLPTLLLIIPMIVAFGVAVAGTFDPVSSTIAGVFGVVLIILTWILNLWQGASIRQKERLKADRQAADTVGHDRFTQSLQKLQSFRLPDIEKREKQGFTTHFSKSPKLSRRIRNLGGP
ncbi:MAG TPA: hypothetical protein VFE96_05580, partial [Candidatus Bathyarchaeia archaeon]|nr:hypothetical protein [Candidatus Bathyarchaeia archaeon]